MIEQELRCIYDSTQGYFEVDSVLARCEKVGRELNRAMAAWNVESRPSSRLGSPAASADDEDDGALTLSSVVRGGAAKTGDYLEQQPSNLAKGIQLKDYQLVGVNWLNLLYNKKTVSIATTLTHVGLGHEAHSSRADPLQSCILADEMGLGKTAQVISFMAHLQQRGISGPHLVVVPSSVLENWSREFKAFAPGIRVETYYGNQREREQLRAEFREDDGIEVMITTYDMAAGGPLDHNFLRKRGFDVRVACVCGAQGVIGHAAHSSSKCRYASSMRATCSRTASRRSMRSCCASRRNGACCSPAPLCRITCKSWL